MMTNATIYRRRNGDFGAACDEVSDTGHTIIQIGSKFTVWNLDGDLRIAENASREDAEKAIADDWRALK